MSQSMALVGLDVHQAQTVAACLTRSAASCGWSGCAARRRTLIGVLEHVPDLSKRLRAADVLRTT